LVSSSSSSSSSSSLLLELTEKEYSESCKCQFPPNGNNGRPFQTPTHKLPYSFEFKDYAPSAYRAVRSISGLREEEYIRSVAGDFNYIEFIANSKSGQFFFYSHDGKYMIKTMTEVECKLLRDIMPIYVEHLNENPDSLLVRFYGNIYFYSFFFLNPFTSITLIIVIINITIIVISTTITIYLH